jgi:hypothetical protein
MINRDFCRGALLRQSGLRHRARRYKSLDCDITAHIALVLAKRIQQD